MIRVDPDRARRYQLRTLTRPEESIRLTPEDLEAADTYQRAWAFGAPQADTMPIPPVMDWHDRVRRYCHAKGLGTPTLMSTDNPDGTKTLQWAPRSPK